MRHVADHGPRSRATIAIETGFNKTTVSSLVAELIDKGLLRETGEEENPGAIGRPGQIVEVDGDVVAGIGVEINVDFLAACATDLKGRIRYAEQVSADNRHARPEVVCARLAELTARVVKSVLSQGLLPVGVAVAVPGLVDVDHGVMVFAPNLGWKTTPVADLLRQSLGATSLPIRVDNGPNLGAASELWEGAARGLEDFVYISGEIGVGGGMVVGGEVFRGASGFGGEFGHVTMDPNGRPCGCGSRGCLETVAGQEALLRLAGIEDPPGTPTKDLTETIVEHARRGDARTTEALEAVGRSLGIAAASLVNLFDPQAIVLGGYFAPLVEWLVDPMRDELQARSMAARYSHVQVLRSELGWDAALRGGALLSLRELIADPSAIDALRRAAR